ncbi:carboxylating nicotinate-nucleotide diphosphorylase [Tissierella pigra]|uniref:Probable nicotinate-nucleotide pyrophosphorylase [carboxylating] n=1 Tax=Tissierella pigra TaxID=2607614 RepID=A0A6N7Y2H6_9FIRM|nr:carboxylating nicotinate-nucleotide diphosphorylase [Tissierella pigra]MBU5427342.1 carboxylating nicotinate-nucleotide diphosphorylase [Tissierella pigra]MSU03054.1 carboxylating nicotinate-nucleotide diphosphorylase [Tissierella pigra]
MNWLIVDQIIKDALIEDAIYSDITTSAIVSYDSKCNVDLISKEDGIIAGLPVLRRVFNILGDVEVDFFVADGDSIKTGQAIGILKGSTYNILIGERIALNLLQRMSGIATITNRAVELVKHTNAKILDTRKTTPNLRILEKYAVAVGGGHNHRFSLSDGVLIKDNHIEAAGGIKKAVNKVREKVSFVRKIEVEVESLEQIEEALNVGVDIIMLDNMDTDTMKKAIELINHRSITEASGNISLDNIRQIAETGVDYISLGMLTHSVKALDISMKNLVLK